MSVFPSDTVERTALAVAAAAAAAVAAAAAAAVAAGAAAVGAAEAVAAAAATRPGGGTCAETNFKIFNPLTSEKTALFVALMVRPRYLSNVAHTYSALLPSNLPPRANRVQ